MNERINELFGQALDEAVPETWTTLNPAQLSRLKEKFAELIVQECLKELKDMIVDESELLYPNNKQTTEFVNNRLLDAYDNIKQHFGVEE